MAEGRSGSLSRAGSLRLPFVGSARPPSSEMRAVAGSVSQIAATATSGEVPVLAT